MLDTHIPISICVFKAEGERLVQLKGKQDAGEMRSTVHELAESQEMTLPIIHLELAGQGTAVATTTLVVWCEVYNVPESLFTLYKQELLSECYH